MKHFLNAIYVLILCCMTSVAFATSYAPADAKKIYSLNKYYYIDFNPNQKQQNVMQENNKKPLWSFNVDNQLGDEFFISNDGKHAYVIRSKFVKIDDLNTPAILIFSPKGKTQYTYSQLGKPRVYRYREVGPIGDFWRVWRGDVDVKPDGLHIQVEGHAGDLVIRF